MADLGVLCGSDLLVAEPPERVEEPAGEGIVAVVDLSAGAVLADDPVLVFPAFGLVGADDLAVVVGLAGEVDEAASRWRSR